jgi:capsular polysaccharide biosynthesis protein
MENLDVMGALRRWYGLVLVAALIGGIAGFLIGPPASGGTTRHYQASHILLVDDEEAPEAAAELLAFLATIGDVPVRVAERLGDGSDPQDLTERVTVEPSRLGTVTITATAGDPAEAASLADLFGEEIVAERREELASGFDDRVSAITAELSALSSRAAELTAAVRVNPQDASVTAQLDGVVAQIALLTQERESLTAERASVDVPVRTVQPALAVARPSDAIDVPLGRYGTAIIGALVGLLLGGLAAVVISRYDPRLHGKTDVERSYGYSVIGAIPMLSRRWRRRRDVITVAEPSSAPAEAYRMLRTSLERLLAGPQPVRALPRSTRAAGARNGRTGAVVLISSALPSEGKTTLVANLAATYAQSGRSVVIVSADLRAPSVNEFLDVPPDLGLADIPAESMPASSLLRATNIEGVKMVLTGRPARQDQPDEPRRRARARPQHHHRPPQAGRHRVDRHPAAAPLQRRGRATARGRRRAGGRPTRHGQGRRRGADPRSARPAGGARPRSGARGGQGGLPSQRLLLEEQRELAALDQPVLPLRPHRERTRRGRVGRCGRGDRHGEGRRTVRRQRCGTTRRLTLWPAVRSGS